MNHPAELEMRDQLPSEDPVRDTHEELVHADEQAAGGMPSQTFLNRFLQSKLTGLALGFLIFMGLLAIFGPMLMPHDAGQQNLNATLQGPSTEHWLGTDDKGRDVLARLVVASRIALQASIVSVGIGLLIGVPLGLLVGYLGRTVDAIVMRIVDAITSIPPLVLILALVGVLGTGLTNTMIALGIVFSTSFLRLTRGETLAVKSDLFVDAARAAGASDRRVLFRHILPVIAPPIIVQATLMTGVALLVEAGLSFLGVGVQPPDASWGSMLSTAQGLVGIAPMLSVPPGVAILLTALSFNLVGDGLRDALAHDHGGVRASRKQRRAADLLARQLGIDPPLEPSNDDALVVRNLSVAFPGAQHELVPALSDVSFSIKRGEIVALVGESGCGKSLTALSVLGLVPKPGEITAGAIELGGRDLLTLPSDELREVRAHHMRAVFQEPISSLNRGFTIGDQLIASVRAAERVSKQQAREIAIGLLTKVGVPEPQNRMRQYPHELSGGLAQRVMIAIALAAKPTLLVADEPTTALDVTVQQKVLDLLQELSEEFGMAILIITHDLGVVADIADRAIVMYAGQVVEQDRTEELLANPRHPYTRGLLASVPLNEPRTKQLGTIPGSVPPPGSWPAGCRFAPRCSLVTDACLAGPIALSREEQKAVRCIVVDLGVPHE